MEPLSEVHHPGMEHTRGSQIKYRSDLANTYTGDSGGDASLGPSSMMKTVA